MLRTRSPEWEGRKSPCILIHLQTQQCGLSSDQPGNRTPPFYNSSPPGRLLCRHFLTDKGPLHSTLLGVLQRARSESLTSTVTILRGILLLLVLEDKRELGSVSFTLGFHLARVGTGETAQRLTAADPLCTLSIQAKTLPCIWCRGLW